LFLRRAIFGWERASVTTALTLTELVSMVARPRAAFRIRSAAASLWLITATLWIPD